MTDYLSAKNKLSVQLWTVSVKPWNKKRWISTYWLWLTVLILASITNSSAQTIIKQATTQKDTTIILISDLHVQLECTQALNDLYNFNFQRAEHQFKYLKSKFPWHPLPYFLMGLIEWWKIMPNTKDVSHDDTFFAYMDSTILTGENLFRSEERRVGKECRSWWWGYE